MKQSKSLVLDIDTTKQIEEIANTVAENLINDIPPDPLKPKNFAKNKMKSELEEQLIDFFEINLKGLKELIETLKTLAANDSTIQLDSIFNQLENLSASMTALSSSPDETRSLKDIAQLDEETMNRFNQAAAFLYQNKEYDKSSAVYAFLSLIDSNEPAFYLGWGNSEYFLENYNQAIKVYESLSTLDPGNPHSYFYAAHCYHALNQKIQALRCVDQALDVIKRDPALAQLKDQAEALKDYFCKLQ